MICYRDALKLDPDASQIRANMGLALLKSGRLSEAIEAFEKALPDMNTDASLHNALGVALIRSGNVARAIGHFKKALTLDPRHQGAKDNLRRALRLKQ